MSRQHDRVAVRPYERDWWVPLSLLVHARLAEKGIILDAGAIPDEPPDTGPDSYEWDLEHMGEVYLRGAGGFWLAWCNELAVGHVGARDLGGVAELRRMFVRADYRRRGIGTRLVKTLIEHCASGGISAIESWTPFDGLGQRLYRTCGFHEVVSRGAEFGAAELRQEMRMRLDLTETG